MGEDRADVEAPPTASEDRLRRLQRVSLELAAAATIDEVVACIVDALEAPVAAPSRGLWLRDPGGDVLELVGHHSMPEEAAARFGRIPLSADLPGAVAAREGRTVVSAAPVDAVEQFASLRDVPRSTTGFLAIPLIGGQDSIGVLGIGIDGVLDDRDRDFFEAVAAQIAQTVIRVRLTERDRRRRAELEFLATLTETALAAIDHHDLMNQVCARAVPMLGDWCSLYFLPENAKAPLMASGHVDPEKAAYIETLLALHPYDQSRPTGVPEVIRSGRTHFVPRVTPELIDEAIASSPLSRDEALAIVEHLGITSAITVPLRTKRRVVGAMQFVRTESGRHYDDDDLALAEAVAGRLAEALDAAWIADRQRIIAVTLQEALLPPALPMIPGIDIAARYWPAGTNHVGGDFYDVFPLGDDRWALVIGDACGTGPDAAALTSIARHTVRAAARHGADAIDVMTWLNDAVLQSNRDLYCTACYATLAAADGAWHLTSTAAGHPLPIVATATGTDTLGRPGTLLGVLPALRTTTAAGVLHAGDVVVLYTDGVTDLPPPHGISTADLVTLVEQLRPRASAAEIADAIYRSLLERVGDHSRHDDIALLVVRVA